MEILRFSPFGFENLIFRPVWLGKSVFSARLASKIRFFNPFGLENPLFQPVWPRKPVFPARLSPVHHTALIYQVVLVCAVQWARND